MKALLSTSVLLLLVGVATPASAATEVFTTDSSHVTSTAGSGYGNSATFTASGGGDHVVITGYQSQQSNGNVTTAQVGVYSPGVGVTGVGDYNGAYGYHQIDNAGGYTDFVELVFDHAVTLSSLTITSFGLGNNSTYDNDLSFLALAGPYNLLNDTPSGWTTINNAGGTVPWNDPGVSTTVTTGSNAVSRYWLVGGSLSSTNDGFKISSLTVKGAVPEPATWAMMLMGFAGIGLAARRRSQSAVLA